MPHEPTIDGLGAVSLRVISDDHPRPHTPSEYEDWGEMAPEAKGMPLTRWLIEVTSPIGEVQVAGDMSAHDVWNGPTPGSRCKNIGISLVEEFRGRGIGGIAQGLLAEELHDAGIVRVEASTDVGNVAEQRALAKAGFAYEGTLRSAQERRDGRHDLQVWSHIGDPDR